MALRIQVTFVRGMFCPCTRRTFAAVKHDKIQIYKKKRRLDEVCLERYQQYSRTFIQSWILQGKVLVDGRVINKAGTSVSEKSVIEIKAEIPKYVCRAGYKLEAAIEQLHIDIVGKVALDSGLSTGGFTDCLLQHGASFVYGVDVGYGQVADKIRAGRTCMYYRTNKLEIFVWIATSGGHCDVRFVFHFCPFGDACRCQSYEGRIHTCNSC
ncbi:hypothetical protein HPP92_007362 [Vanilla planifolia]|uniref:RNA-binding S4 domain-containing protein n=1 Tax=Vanilla planifolia TaxID=51239 RepID=A0A835RK57_VANPL|nr:hypothetical protein HPP92_007362 [Vanilla planifolia]